MAKVVFTSHLQRHLDAPPADAAGGTVREVLDTIFSRNPRLRGYVLDDQGSLRQHVVVFVDGERGALESPVRARSEVYVLQALSGG